MILDPEFNAMKIENVNLEVKYNPENNSVNIGTQNINYYIVIPLLQNTTGNASDVEKRASEVGNTVKSYFIEHPEELKRLGSTVHLALVNSTGLASYTNLTYITTGIGPIKI